MSDHMNLLPLPCDHIAEMRATFEANSIFNVKSCKLGHDFDEAGKSDGQGLGRVCRNPFLADAA